MGLNNCFSTSKEICFAARFISVFNLMSIPGFCLFKVSTQKTRNETIMLIYCLVSTAIVRISL